MKPITIFIILFFIQFNLNAQNFEWAYKKATPLYHSYPTYGIDVTCDSVGNAYNLWKSYGSHGIYTAITGVTPNGVDYFTRSFLNYQNGVLNNLTCVNDSLYAAVKIFKRFYFDSVEMISQGFWDVAGVKMNLNGICLYGKHGGSAPINYETSASFLPDNFNNIYMLGTYSGIANFNGDTIISSGLNDVVLAKYRPDKSMIYLKSMGGSGHDYAVGMNVNPNNGIIVYGNYENDFIVDNDTLNSSGMLDIFLTKFNSFGQLLWVKSFGSPLDDKVSKCAVDSAGNIYVTGIFNSGFLVDGVTLNSSGGKDIFIAKFSKSGQLIWTKTFGTLVDDTVADIKVNNKQFIFVGGSFTDTLNIDTLHRISKSNYDLYVIKLDTSGIVQWIERAGAADTTDIDKNCYLTGLVPDLYGNIYVTGAFKKQSGFGDNTLINLGKDQSFIAKINDSYKVQINGSVFCEGDTVTVLINSQIAFDLNNYFIVELSDETGHFANSILIDTIYSTSQNFQLTVALKNILNTSDKYQFRIKSSNPNLTSVSDHFEIYAHANSISGATQICTNQQIWLHGGNRNESSYQWLLNGNALSGATDSIYFTDVNQSGIYNYVISNYCFTDTSADFNLPYVATTLPIFNIPYDTMNVNCADTLNLNYYVIPTGGFFSGYYVHDSLFIPPLFNNNFLPIYYTHTDTLGCNYTISDSLHLHFDDYIQFSGFPPGPLCHSNPPFIIITAPAGGTLLSNCGNCLQGNTFYPVYAPYFQNYAILTYSLQGIYGCVEQKTILFVVDNCVGIEQSDASQLTCSYNQNMNALEFSNLKNGKVDVNLFSVEGKLLLNQNLNSNTENAVINLNTNLCNGIYFVTVEEINSKYNFKFVVNR